MARAILEAQRNTRKIWLPLNSGQPILNHGVEFTVENVRHTLNSASIAAAFETRNRAIEHLRLPCSLFSLPPRRPAKLF